MSTVDIFSTCDQRNRLSALYVLLHVLVKVRHVELAVGALENSVSAHCGHSRQDWANQHVVTTLEIMHQCHVNMHLLKTAAASKLRTLVQNALHLSPHCMGSAPFLMIISCNEEFLAARDHAHMTPPALGYRQVLVIWSLGVNSPNVLNFCNAIEL